MLRLHLWITFGGALRSAMRFFISGRAASRFGATFPRGTFIVNVLGSVAVFLLAVWLGHVAAMSLNHWKGA
jgi:CrcB protein